MNNSHCLCNDVGKNNAHTYTLKFFVIYTHTHKTNMLIMG